MKRAVFVGAVIGILIGHWVAFGESLRPRYLQAFPGNGNVYIRWSQPAAEVMGYWVYRALPNRSFQRLTLNPVDTAVYEDTDVVNGMVYWYTVSVIHADGNEGPSAEPVVAIPSAQPGYGNRY